ncbi:Carbohydrate-binding WSC [Fusarium oxysporum f. sp. vasinfectum]|uniref:WSC domain-containing protein n=1 Tax=Fusarium oxysporum f. sp. vasinfectum 25433 TaxID=1089449 RepID=X0KRI6_FUSOX|nr:hypothetical protein FOTG_15502 [Fusarium oxysporum f. sp. vasinfectum 25433]KAK2674449.1 Carbohydrate-binding WSC [Fusarium oxysporum f. sp. vasinfectum]KAK2693476.1 hypothetical protein QWA68_006856 [Fusarium oxysporum]KAK2930883.1 Carbohydrate-binding WSC [Fusarium oxysporum f. sp. vasinfectum]
MATFSLLHAALFFWVALVAAQSSSLEALKHKGCYRARSRNFVVGGFSRNKVQRQKCVDTCTRRGQQWIAFDSVNCFCSDVAPPSYYQIDNNRCNAQCIGILNGDCVKQPRNNAFEDDNEPYSIFFIPSTADEANDALSHPNRRPSSQQTESKQLSTNHGKVGKITAQGCYYISMRPSMLKKVLIRDDDSRRECAKICAQDEKPLAFISGNACSCGSMYPGTDATAGSNKCYMPCLSDGDDRCQRDSEYNPARHDPYTAVYDTGLGVDVETEPSIATKLLNYEKTSPKHTEPNGHPGQACYKTVPTDTVSKMFARNSPMLCHRFCQRKGRMYAFTLDQICHCSNEYPDKKDELPDSQCNVQCPGTNFFNCGGDNVAFSVYNLGPERRPVIEPKPIRQIERCFYDIPMTASRIPLDPGAISKLPSSCIDSCKAAGQGVAFIKGSQCHCSQGYPRSGSTTDLRECQIPCAGDSQYSCGGYGVTADTFSAYRTGYAGGRYRIQQESNNRGHMQKPYEEPSLGYVTSHGCYNMQSATLTHKKLENMNNLEQCARYCQREDKPVAAVQRGWCLCSDTYPAKSARVDDAQCANWCPGWSREACGGRRTWSVVNTGITTEVVDDELKIEEVERPVKVPKRPTEMGLSKLKPHGCFTLPGFTSSYPPRVRITGPYRSSNGDSCNRQCTNKGYSVALRHGSRCFCSNKLPDESARIDDDKCWFTSIFDTREQCGGPDDAYSVYRLGSNWSDPEEKEVPKGDNPSNSPVKRPQCLHHGMQRIYETLSWAITKIGEFAQNVRDGLAGFLDKAQDVFDACLWRVMVAFSDVMYSLGWRSSSGDVDL